MAKKKIKKSHSNELRPCSCGCHRYAAKGRKISNTCKSREYSKKNPIIMIWHWIKKSAKKRNLEFSITKQELTEFLSKNNYVAERGRLKDQMTLDRKEGLLGYHIWNLQVIPKSQNCQKYHQGDKETYIEPQAPF